MATRPVLAVIAVGLTPRLLPHAPALSRLASEGFSAPLDPVFPAVTCTVQSTFTTGLTPDQHGIVANGWYFRDLGEVLLWRQHNGLVAGDKVWDAARRARPGFTTANLCWWYAMGAATDLTVTPRPIYRADGRKDPDCYTDPPELHDELTAQLGPFPLFSYWGPAAGIASSRWLAEAAVGVLRRHRPDLTLLYLPHLDYDLQRFGPHSPEAIKAVQDLDAVASRAIDAARAQGVEVVVLSEYGITPVRRHVALNRVLRREGLLRVYTQDGMEYLDPWTSPAFAVADHQVAHVYVKDPSQVARVRDLVAAVDGVEQALAGEDRAALGMTHERAGEVVAVAAADSWFSYYYWLDDARAPDFAPLVEIHRKPGYDPAELFLHPPGLAGKAKVAKALARKAAGMRYTMDVVPLDGGMVRGSHGRLPDDDADGPVLLCTDPAFAQDRYAATEVKDLLLRVAGLPT